MSYSCERFHLSILWLLFMAVACMGGNASAQTDRRILSELTSQDAKHFFPEMQLLAKAAKDIPARAVFGRRGLEGYVFISSDFAPIPAYSGKPVSVLIGVGIDRKIKGAVILYQEEPILVVGISEEDLQRYTEQYSGLNVHDRVRIDAHGREGYVGVDGITGATISLMVINRSVMKSVRMVTEAFLYDVEKQPKRIDSEEEKRLEMEYWLQIWKERPVPLILLMIAFFVLLVILFFQDLLVVRKQMFVIVRSTYLVFTVGFIGYYLGAQLSIMNMLTFFIRISGEFSWETLMIDPAIFLLWAFVAVSILLWGRGVFCGWLCPFGALQELLHKMAIRLGLPRFELSSMVHERLWAIKYFILIALVGISLDSIGTAAIFVEVEPFKTSFSLAFQREWWFVLYAVGLLVISLFNSKFYCKYLCPLGAALSIMGRYQIFEWLRRRNDCGHPCQACAAICQIGALKSTGEIVKAECHYCLQCQVLYWDEHTCPPLVAKRLKQEKRQKKRCKKDVSIIPAKNIDEGISKARSSK